jgi:hypothetical protein
LRRREDDGRSVAEGVLAVITVFAGCAWFTRGMAGAAFQVAVGFIRWATIATLFRDRGIRDGTVLLWDTRDSRLITRPQTVMGGKELF